MLDISGNVHRSHVTVVLSSRMIRFFARSTSSNLTFACNHALSAILFVFSKKTKTKRENEKEKEANQRAHRKIVCIHSHEWRNTWCSRWIRTKIVSRRWEFYLVIPECKREKETQKTYRMHSFSFNSIREESIDRYVYMYMYIKYVTPHFLLSKKERKKNTTNIVNSPNICQFSRVVDQMNWSVKREREKQRKRSKQLVKFQKNNAKKKREREKETMAQVSDR